MSGVLSPFMAHWRVAAPGALACTELAVSIFKGTLVCARWASTIALTNLKCWHSFIFSQLASQLVPCHSLVPCHNLMPCANAVRQASLGARVSLLQLRCALARGYDKHKHLHAQCRCRQRKQERKAANTHAATGDEAKHGCMCLIAASLPTGSA